MENWNETDRQTGNKLRVPKLAGRGLKSVTSRQMDKQKDRQTPDKVIL